MFLDQSEKSQVQAMLMKEADHFASFLLPSIDRDLQADKYDAYFVGKLAELCLYLYNIGSNLYDKEYFLSNDDDSQCLFQVMEEHLTDDLYIKICEHFNIEVN